MPMNKKWMILVCLIVLIIIGIACSIFFAKKKEKDRDYELMQEVEYKYYVLEVGGKYGVIKRDGTVMIEPIYDEVQIPNQDKEIFIVKESDMYKVFNENSEQIFKDITEVTAISGTNSIGEVIYNNTVLKYKENDKYGLLDFKGKKVTEALYEEMTSLTDKYGEILVKKDGKLGVINVKGINLVDTKFDYIKGDGYVKNGSYKDSGYIIGNKSNQGMRYGYIDKNEKEIIKLEQESIYRVTEIDSDDTYVIASQNGRYALYKNKENMTDYRYINMHYNNGTNLFTVQKNKSFGLINLSGEIIISEEYEELQVVGIYVKAHKNGVDYTFDFNGKLVENSKFASLQPTITEKYYISIDDNYRYGIVDKEKNIVVENIYDYIEEIEETGLLIATIGTDITIYSANATEIVSVERAELKMIGKYIEVNNADESYFLTDKGKKVDNKTVYLENAIYAGKSGDKWGFVDLKDNVIVPYEYDEVTELNEYGFAGVKKDGKWGVINSEGLVILEPTYESDIVNPLFIGRYYKDGNIVRDTIN